MLSLRSQRRTNWFRYPVRGIALLILLLITTGVPVRSSASSTIFESIHQPLQSRPAESHVASLP
jgi:hypothetical protein